MASNSLETELPLVGQFETLAEAFTAAAAQFTDREAYVDGARRLTFGEWFDKSSRLAGWMADEVRQGDVVAIWLSSSLEFAIVIGAAILVGGVPTGINPRLGSSEVGAIRSCARPRIWFTEDHLELPHLDDDEGSIRVNRTGLLDLLETIAQSPIPVRSVRPEDPAIISWTGGTTGMPKGVWFNHRNLEAAVRLAGPMTRAFDRRLAPPIFAHAGYLTKVWEQFAFGMALIVPPAPWKAAAAMRTMIEEKVTTAAGVPTQWEKLVAESDTDPDDFAQLRVCIVSAAPTSPELRRAVQRTFGAPMLVRYAMTECPTIAGTSPDEDPADSATTVGRALPGIELEIRDGRGRPLPAGHVGAITVRAPCMMRGYWNAPRETQAALTADGWLTTGDMGFIDDAGRLSLVGRATEMYIRGGYNIYPLEVERVLSTHPRIAQIAVVGLAAPVIGEQGVACIVPSDPDRPPTLEDVRAWSQSKLADYKAPDRVEILESLPLTPVMKVDKRELRRLLTRS